MVTTSFPNSLMAAKQHLALARAEISDQSTWAKYCFNNEMPMRNRFASMKGYTKFLNDTYRVQSFAYDNTAVHFGNV